MRTKEEYENLINNSPLFDIDKESDFAKYGEEKNKLLRVILDYYHYHIYKNKGVDKSGFYKGLEEYGYSLMKTADNCIKAYEKENGEFVHYLNRSVMQNLNRDRGKEHSDQVRKGIQIPTQTRQDISKIIKCIKYLKATGKIDAENMRDILRDTEIHEKIAEKLGMTLAKVQQLLRINNEVAAISSSVKGKGEEMNVLDLEQSRRQATKIHAVDTVADDSAVTWLVEQMESEFSKRRRVLKEKLSALLTVEIIKVYKEDLKKAWGVLRGKTMCKKEIFDFYDQNGRLPTRIEIGKIIGMQATEASMEAKLSKVLKEFKEACQKSKKQAEVD